ncbi:DUF1178 family protein [Sphingomonas cannabina]|uniref:DUF1178 family protein n=1 Tax=Sphingomonas cannabina TaxID=2899123 RepID=UPI001F2D6C2C|nr:DUF1178 family protein [Sphingomonas cannabina]UIJ44074.1 DUF1178 family protein [Sphingomonas cannabina]
MIAFDLKCASGHVFEAWFASSTAYEEQRAGSLIACPMCGVSDVAKAVMAPNVASKGNRRDARPTPEAVKAALAAIAAEQAEALKTSQWVGMAFADKARAMHLGDEPAGPIHGQATPDQARALVEEGVPVAPLLVPVVPPETLN